MATPQQIGYLISRKLVTLLPTLQFWPTVGTESQSRPIQITEFGTYAGY